MKATVFDSRISTLGEGPLWHPIRKQLFWFDILGRTLHSRDGSGPISWNMGEYCSAAGWIDADRLLVATETGLWLFDIATGHRERIAEVEADNAETRSNDGRADPWGGFWIGTMGKKPRQGLGAIYRLYKGEVRKLFDEVTIPNAISFLPDGSGAYFADTTKQKVMKVGLNADNGQPEGGPEVFLDLTSDDLNPDGAVVDADGLLWIAQWGASRVAAYDRDGKFVKAVSVSAPQASCPAFGGEDFSTLFITTARENMTEEIIGRFPESGMVFQAPGAGRGRAEYQVIL
jgi:sugar lactone lactonase YvrE